MRHLLAFAVLLALTVAASAQDTVHFASLDGAADRAPTPLDGYLFTISTGRVSSAAS